MFMSLTSVHNPVLVFPPDFYSIISPFSCAVSWIMSSQNSSIKARTANVTVFGDRAYWEVIMVKWSQGCGMIGRVSLWKETLKSSCLHPLHLVRTQQEADCLKTRKRALTKNWMGQHLDLRFPSLQSCEKRKFCCLSKKKKRVCRRLNVNYITIKLGEISK